MARMPDWIVITGERTVEVADARGRVVGQHEITFRIRRWHPGLWLFLARRIVWRRFHHAAR